MVSYPEDGSTRTSVSSSEMRSQRSTSIASSSRAPLSTVRRHHRHPRSHAGGGGGSSSVQLQNEFPLFLQTGDVEIVIKSKRKEQRYVLHRLILAQCSGFFEAGMSEEWSGSVNGSQNGGAAVDTNGSILGGGRSSSGNSRRWRYELDWGEGGDDIPMLIKKPPTSASFTTDYSSRPPPLCAKPPPSSSNGFFRSMANFTSLNLPQQTQASEDPEDEIFQTYDNLFRSFYNYAPMLDSVQIAEAYVQCKMLVQVADMYDALEVIGPRIDHHLLRFHGRLWKQIAKYPPSYLKLGYLARSKAIFQEALIHVVGQWPAGQHQLRNHVPTAVMEMIEDKVDELEETKARVEAKLWRLTLTTSRGERVTPHNAWLDWQMMSLWRQWFAENTTPQPASILKPPPLSSSYSGDRHHRTSSRDAHSTSSARTSSHSTAIVPTRGSSLGPSQNPTPQHSLNTGRIFRLIGTGGSAYLPHDEVKRFLKISPELYSRESVRRAERRLDELKNLARDAVKPLMRCWLELDLREGGLGYLGCTRMEGRDWQLVFGDD